MTDRVQRPALGLTIQELKRDTASFSRAGEALEDAADELSPDGISGDLHKSIAKFQDGVVALAAGLLAIVRRAERAMTLAELGEDATLENDPTPQPNYSQVEVSRESAANALAAAMIKTSGGDITRQEDLIPALHAAEHVIDAIADHVLARQRNELSLMLMAAGAR